MSYIYTVLFLNLFVLSTTKVIRIGIHGQYAYHTLNSHHEGLL